MKTKTKKPPQTSQKHNSVVITRAKGAVGWEEVEECKGGINGDGWRLFLDGDLTWGCEHTIRYTEDV